MDMKAVSSVIFAKTAAGSMVARKLVDTVSLWRDYVFKKQTLVELSANYGISVSSVRRHLKKHRSVRIISSDKQVVVLVDVTYWGRSFGVVVFKDAQRKKILWRKFVRYETLADYREGIGWLEANGFIIKGIVCDGLRGMFSLLSGYNVQMCQYHQIKIVKRYLTLQPELEASKELLKIINRLAHSDKNLFIAVFEQWTFKWNEFLKERRIDKKSGKSHFVHKKLRSAA
ncbi:MAG: transposase [Prevotellaceae bacterium]|jgi:hypothetical protein|nr:transposase [Prevotellaceae bacterium]